MNGPRPSQEGFPCTGTLSTGQAVHGVLILRYGRQVLPGFPYPVGTGMERWCDLTVEGTAPLLAAPVEAAVVSERLGERLYLQITPQTVTGGDGTWRVQGPYDLRSRQKLSGADAP